MNAALFHKKRNIFEDLQDKQDWSIVYQLYKYFSCGDIAEGKTIRDIYNAFRADENMQQKLNKTGSSLLQIHLKKSMTLRPYKKEVKYNYFDDGTVIESDLYGMNKNILNKQNIKSLGSFTRTKYFTQIYKPLSKNINFDSQEEESISKIKDIQIKNILASILASKDEFKNYSEDEILSLIEPKDIEEKLKELVFETIYDKTLTPPSYTITTQQTLQNRKVIDGTPYSIFSVDIKTKEGIHELYTFAVDTSKDDIFEDKKSTSGSFSINSDTIQDVKDYMDQLKLETNQVLSQSMFLEKALLFERQAGVIDLMFENQREKHPELLIVDVPLLRGTRQPFTILENITLNTGVYQLDAIVVHKGAHYFSVLNDKEGWVVYNDTEIQEGETLRHYFETKQRSTTSADQDKANILLNTIAQLEKTNVQTAGNPKEILNAIKIMLPDEADVIDAQRVVEKNDAKILADLKAAREEVTKEVTTDLYKPAIIPSFQELLKTRVSNSQVFVNENARVLVYSRLDDVSAFGAPDAPATNR